MIFEQLISFWLKIVKNWSLDWFRLRNLVTELGKTGGERLWITLLPFVTFWFILLMADALILKNFYFPLELETSFFFFILFTAFLYFFFFKEKKATTKKTFFLFMVVSMIFPFLLFTKFIFLLYSFGKLFDPSLFPLLSLGRVESVLSPFVYLFFWFFLLYLLIYFSLSVHVKRKEESERLFFLLLSFFSLIQLIEASNFLFFYLILELYSLSNYLLVSFNLQSKQVISNTLKYFLSSIFGSLFFLLGVAVFFAITGSINFDFYPLFFSLTDSLSYPLLFAFFFFWAGLLLKFGFIPFHFWVLPVYEGLPFLLFFYLLLFPKYLFFLLLLKFQTILPVDFFYPFYFGFLTSLVLIGSLGAIFQNSFRQFFVFTSWSNFGFISISLLLSLGTTTQASLFEGFTYFFSYFLVQFLFLFFFLKGFWLHQRNAITSPFNNHFYTLQRLPKGLRWLFALLFLIFSGFPPFSIFFCKISLFSLLIEKNLTFLTIFFLLITVLSSFYYLHFLRLFLFIPRWVSTAPLTPQTKPLMTPFGRLSEGVLVAKQGADNSIVNSRSLLSLCVKNKVDSTGNLITFFSWVFLFFSLFFFFYSPFMVSLLYFLFPSYMY